MFRNDRAQVNILIFLAFILIFKQAVSRFTLALFFFLVTHIMDFMKVFTFLQSRNSFLFL